jgi:hypothetical protein
MNKVPAPYSREHSKNLDKLKGKSRIKVEWVSTKTIAKRLALSTVTV